MQTAALHTEQGIGTPIRDRATAGSGDSYARQTVSGRKS
jgi:hypothetical protein